MLQKDPRTKATRPEDRLREHENQAPERAFQKGAQTTQKRAKTEPSGGRKQGVTSRQEQGHRTRNRLGFQKRCRRAKIPNHGKHTGTALGNNPKTDQKRCRLRAENGPSESSRKSFGRALAEPRTKATGPDDRLEKLAMASCGELCNGTCSSGASPRLAQGQQIILFTRDS